MFSLWEQCEKYKLESKTIPSPKAGMAAFCRQPNHSPVQKEAAKPFVSRRLFEHLTANQTQRRRGK
jgi:hypothetical protein